MSFSESMSFIFRISTFVQNVWHEIQGEKCYVKMLFGYFEKMQKVVGSFSKWQVGHQVVSVWPQWNTLACCHRRSQASSWLLCSHSCWDEASKRNCEEMLKLTIMCKTVLWNFKTNAIDYAIMKANLITYLYKHFSICSTKSSLCRLQK